VASVDQVRELMQLGQADFAENRVQQLAQRVAQVEEWRLRRAELGGDRVTLLGARIESSLEGRARVTLLGASPPAAAASPKPAKGRRGARQPADAAQQVFGFALEQNLRRGLFGSTEPTLFNGEDVDVPTYLRKGVRIQAAP